MAWDALWIDGEMMEPRLKNRIDVERDYGRLPRVQCYAGQLSQVFLNLFVNACDAIADHGKILIRTSKHGDGIRIEITDDGSGISEEVKSRIFDPFFTTKPIGAGTGLGLSLSHGIIERHAGVLSVESESGVGTSFRIDLPLEVPPVDE